MSDLKELMNQGFLIFESSTNFVLKKVPTPANPKQAITDKVEPDTSVREFNSYDAAFQVACQLAGLQKESPALLWEVNLRYFHNGLGFKTEALEPVEKETYALAMAVAKQQAERFVEKELDERHVTEWEVRVRPTRQTP